jgi:hypothetical protein
MGQRPRDTQSLIINFRVWVWGSHLPFLGLEARDFLFGKSRRKNLQVQLPESLGDAGHAMALSLKDKLELKVTRQRSDVFLR